MAVYDIHGNVISGGGSTPSDLNQEALTQLYYTLPFDTWRSGKLNDVSVGAKQTVASSTTNYCIDPSDAIYLQAGTVISLVSASSNDLSYKRLDENGNFVANMKTDGISSNTFIRGTTFKIVLIYDGYYCFNSYNSNYSSVDVAKNNLSMFVIYGTNYISQYSSYDLWRDTLNDSMRTINHRGYTSSGAVENTLPAFEESKKHGYVYVECDLRLTSDNEIVLSHNDSITGKDSGGTSQTLTIASNTLDSLKALTIGSGRFECSILTLDELLEFCRKNNMHPYLDMKVTTEAAMDLYIDCVIKHGMLRHVSWSGNTATSEYILTKDKQARVICLSGSVAGISALLNGQNEVVLNTSITNITSASNVKNYVIAGIVVEAYKIGNPTVSEITTMASYGVTGMTIDNMHCQQVIQ